MPALNVSRTTMVAVDKDYLRTILTDFKQWPAWSPWLIQDPSCRVSYRDGGRSYAWEGEWMGAGSMVLDSESNYGLRYTLTFLKPWKCVAKVYLLLSSEEDKTRVTWKMDSHLPFFMCFMKKKMEVFVGMDYERGLTMLRAYAETGSVPSKLDFEGVSAIPANELIGFRRECSLAEINSLMARDCESLACYVKSLDTKIVGPMRSIYETFEPAKDKVIYHVALPVSSLPTVELPYETLSVPAINAYKLAHKGPYSLLGNAWSSLYSMERAKEIKPDKDCKPYEVYLNMPGEVPDEALITELYFPVKN